LNGPDKKLISPILRSKRDITRFQIITEIAEHQPAVRQQEVAKKLGITPQAVSDYIRELVEEGMVSTNGRGRYEVTKEGIEWVTTHAELLEAYARHIRRDIIQQVSVWTAIAAVDLREGDEVGAYMQDGFLYAGLTPRTAIGTALAGVKEGEDVGVARLNGIIDHKEGVIHVCKVPRVQRGGSRKVDIDHLSGIIKDIRLVGAIGVEAYISLLKAKREPDMFFGAREGAIEAAFHGLEVAVVIVDEEFTDFLKRLESVSLTYVIHDLSTP